MKPTPSGTYFIKNNTTNCRFYSLNFYLFHFFIISTGTLTCIHACKSTLFSLKAITNFFWRIKFLTFTSHYIISNITFSFCNIVNTQYHILRRVRNRSTTLRSSTYYELKASILELPKLLRDSTVRVPPSGHHQNPR